MSTATATATAMSTHTSTTMWTVLRATSPGATTFRTAMTTKAMPVWKVATTHCATTQATATAIATLVCPTLPSRSGSPASYTVLGGRSCSNAS